MKPLAILVVDDQPILREVLGEILEEAGHDVRLAADGGEALRKMSCGHYDVLLTDVVMPGIDGIELIGEVRRRYPWMRVIAMSAGSGNFSNTNCLEIATRVGANVALAKPFDGRRLLQAVDYVCPAQTMAFS